MTSFWFILPDFYNICQALAWGCLVLWDKMPSNCVLKKWAVKCHIVRPAQPLPQQSEELSLKFSLTVMLAVAKCLRQMAALSFLYLHLLPSQKIPAKRILSVEQKPGLGRLSAGLCGPCDCRCSLAMATPPLWEWGDFTIPCEILHKQLNCRKHCFIFLCDANLERWFGVEIQQIRCQIELAKMTN